MENKFNAAFDRYACEGDSITAIIDGFTITATIHRDDCQDKPDQRDDGFWPSMQPESAGYLGTVPREEYEKALARANAVMDAWKKDEWFYCGIVLSVAREGVTLDDHAASLWGCECNYPKNPDAASALDDYPNNYLTETANELLDEALTSAKKIFTNLCAGYVESIREGGTA